MNGQQRKPCSPGCMGHITHPCEKCGTQWSDKPSYQDLETRNEKLEHALRELLKAGAHDGPCDNEDIPDDCCELHLEAYGKREAAAYEILNQEVINEK